MPSPLTVEIQIDANNKIVPIPDIVVEYDIDQDEYNPSEIIWTCTHPELVITFDRDAGKRPLSGSRYDFRSFENTTAPSLEEAAALSSGEFRDNLLAANQNERPFKYNVEVTVNGNKDVLDPRIIIRRRRPLNP
ncbi:MAG: hypothetical protein U0Z53_05265 [Blastocatellia bacterium]